MDTFMGKSNKFAAGRATLKHTCALTVSVRVMPGNEIPPAMRVDFYFIHIHILRKFTEFVILRI